MEIRALTSLEDFARVVALEKAIWGYPTSDDAVSVPIFVVSVKRGGLLLGAFDDAGALVGFTYSLVGLCDGRPMQWSHMLGVVPGHRSSGIGYRLKLAQRERTLAQGLDLVEWTYDPLQAGNAHFNFARLRVTAREYAVDVYGSSSSPLHAGCPTDRLIARWDLLAPRVIAQVRGDAPPGPEVATEGALPLNAAVDRGGWQRPGGTHALPAGATRLLVEIPGRFTEMLAQAPSLALEWRLATRELFLACVARGFRVVEFFRHAGGGGRYLLVRDQPSAGDVPR